jgi:hypothetical protein
MADELKQSLLENPNRSFEAFRHSLLCYIYKVSLRYKPKGTYSFRGGMYMQPAMVTPASAGKCGCSQKHRHVSGAPTPRKNGPMVAILLKMQRLVTKWCIWDRV